ncbi:MAG: DNA-3-methyladenine glycosylase family protein [Caldilineaceae bacterium]
MVEQLQLYLPKPYTFAVSVCDHGWPVLAPNQWLADQQRLQRVEQLTTGQVVLLQITGEERDDAICICIAVQTDGALTTAETTEILSKVRWMLKLDEDFAAFYALVAAHPHIGRVVAQGRGRLLRSPTLWEDVVKTIATTNVTWGNTKSMIGRLVDHLGAPFPLNPTLRAFPTPAQVAAADPALFASSIRMGYRNAYVQTLAQEIVTGARDLEALKTAQRSAVETKKAVKSIKGIGDYAAHTLMMLLGHYSELPIDSELRSHVTRRYFAGEARPDKEMAAIYDAWGDWKYLAYWFDAYD